MVWPLSIQLPFSVQRMPCWSNQIQSSRGCLNNVLSSNGFIFQDRCQGSCNHIPPFKPDAWKFALKTEYSNFAVRHPPETVDVFKLPGTVDTVSQDHSSQFSMQPRPVPLCGPQVHPVARNWNNSYLCATEDNASPYNCCKDLQVSWPSSVLSPWLWRLRLYIVLVAEVLLSRIVLVWLQLDSLMSGAVAHHVSLSCTLK